MPYHCTSRVQAANLCCSVRDSVVCPQDCRIDILESAQYCSMAGGTIETGESWGPEESKPSPACRGWCCPHCVLEISHEAPLEDGRKKVEDAISNWEAQTEDEWILHMKMCVYPPGYLMGQRHPWDPMGIP